MKRRSNRSNSRVGVLCSAALFVTFAGPAFANADEAPAQAAAETAEIAAGETEVDASARIGNGADAVLRAMNDYLTEASGFSFRADVVSETVADGAPAVESHRSYSVALARPNRVRVAARSGGPARVTWVDAGVLTLWTPETNTWGRVELPGDLDAALDDLAERWDAYPPLGDLLYSDLYAVLTENVLKGAYAGLHELDGVLCHHLVFQQASIDWQIWIDAGLQRVPRRIAIRYTSLPGQPRWSADFHDWQLEPRFPVDLFTPTIPASATKIELLPTDDQDAAE